MLAALRNVSPSHLLDPELAAVWAEHGTPRGKHEPGDRERHGALHEDLIQIT
jgi:hypothetical protein